MHWRQKRRAGEEAIRRNWRAKFLESSSVSKSRSQEGKCFLVGAGPGDLGLVTLRAKELLERADVIVYDALVNPEMLDWAPVDAEIVFAGKRAGEKTFSQDEINALLIEKSRLGKNIVRLKGGDPFVFGRGGEEAEALAAAGVDFEIVPGITSAIAAPAYAGIPVTHRDQTSHVTFFTGHEDPAKSESAINFDALAKLGGTQVMLMGVDRLAAMTSELRALGADVIQLPTIRIAPPSNLREFAELVQDAHSYDWIIFTSPNGVESFFEIFFKLYDDAREIGGAKIAAIGPATAQRIRDFHLHVDLQPEEFVAEAVVKEFERSGGVENLRILIARAERARDLLPKRLTGMGAIVDEAFAYQTVPETRDVTGAHRRFSSEGADLITFTSSSTVENFLDLKLPWPAGMKVASIGPITSATLRERGLSVDVEANRHDVVGLIEAIRKFYGA